VRRLLEHRAGWEALCADPALIPHAVEEVAALRLLGHPLAPPHTRPVELSGVALPADADVLVSIGAANRDPAVFADPDRFDIRRPEAGEHLSFGFGPHYCLGAPLARLEARVVLEELTSALPMLRLRPDQTFAFAPIIGFRGPRAVHVEWDRRRASSRDASGRAVHDVQSHVPGRRM
jgi:cytochrome P450